MNTSPSARSRLGRSGLTIRTIESHAAGEPLRIVVEGFPALPGATILARRRYARRHFDHLRRALIGEPRGHADMYGAIITPPERPDSDLGVLFLHNEGFSTMCGHGVIALTTAVLETGLVRRRGTRLELRLDTPAGLVRSTARMDRGRVTRVSFLNVPSFVFARDQEVGVAGLGRVRYDVAFGGAFYAVCGAPELGLRLVPSEFHRIIDLGRRITEAVGQSLFIRHPLHKDLGFLYGTILVGPPLSRGHHSRNVCVFAEGEVDRSPTGTGVSARAALHFARGEIRRGQAFAVESILGTCFTGRVAGVGTVGPFEAVVPEVTGSAFLTGRAEWRFDPRDPLACGFFLR
jgi:proline racemase